MRTDDPIDLDHFNNLLREGCEDEEQILARNDLVTKYPERPSEAEMDEFRNRKKADNGYRKMKWEGKASEEAAQTTKNDMHMSIKVLFNNICDTSNYVWSNKPLQQIKISLHHTI